MKNKVPNVENVLVEALVDGRLMMDSAEHILTKTLCFDCREMGEPVARDSRQHFGTHPATLKTYAADPQLKEHLQRLRKEIEICKTSNVGCIRLVVFDKRGRWAAMAVGKAFLQRLL